MTSLPQGTKQTSRSCCDFWTITWYCAKSSLVPCRFFLSIQPYFRNRWGCPVPSVYSTHSKRGEVYKSGWFAMALYFILLPSFFWRKWNLIPSFPIYFLSLDISFNLFRPYISVWWNLVLIIVFAVGASTQYVFCNRRTGLFAVCSYSGNCVVDLKAIVCVEEIINIGYVMLRVTS